MARFNKSFSSLYIVERTSAFTSKASITLEASFAVSFFFLAVMCLICLFEIMALQLQVKSALHSAGKEIAVEVYSNPLFYTDRLEQKIVDKIGASRLDNSLIMGGSSGIDCSGTKTYAGSTIMDLCAYYQIEIPFFTFRIPVIAREEIVRIKGWSGAEESFASSQKREMVYVTEHGLVYHKELTCTYLELSIKAVSYGQLEELRNEQGGKYLACEICGKNTTEQTNVFVTQQGTRYHCSLDCRGIKRNIYAVPISDVYGIGGCSKCVK